MALIEVTSTWSDPETLSEKSIISVNYGQVLIAFGSTAPTGENDGIPQRGGFMGLFEEGTVVRFRAMNENARSEVYIGSLA